MKKLIENVRLLTHKVFLKNMRFPSLCIPSAVTAVVGQSLLVRISIPDVAVECVLWRNGVPFEFCEPRFRELK